MTLLITGANGFVGKNLSTYLRSKNIQFLSPTSKELDLTNSSMTNDYFQRNKPNEIIHLAAFAGGIKLNMSRPGDMILINNQINTNLFNAILKYKVEYICALGTVCSYPCYAKIPFKEKEIFDGRPEYTNSFYSEAKRNLLLMQEAFHFQYGLKTAHLLPANLYGIYDNFDPNDSHVIPALIRKTLYAKSNNIPYVECWGTGEASREFLYVGDLCRAIYSTYDKKINDHVPFNIGTGKSIKIKDLIIKISNIIGYTGKIKFTGEVSDGQPERRLDISRSKHLAWKAEISLDDGLRKTIDWFKNES